MRTIQTSLLILAAVALIPGARANTNTWSGPSGGEWSTSGNWTPAGPPGAADEARFFNAGAVADATIDNIISVNTTIQNLWIGQTNPPNHNMQINAGVTLTVTGTNDNGYGPLGSDPDAGGITPDPNPLRYQSTIYVGTKTTNSVTQVLKGAISGAGTLVVSNVNNEILIRQFHPSGGLHRSILDLSALNTFIANLGRIRVGDGEAQPLNRSEGDLFLAKTNTITLTGTNYQDNVQLVVGNNDVNQNQSNPSFMILGGKNTLFVDEILVGGKKQPGTMRSTNGFPTLSLLMRGSDGVSRVRAFRIGDASDQPSSGNGTTGIANFMDDTVDILADTIVVGKSQSSGTGNGSLSLGNFLLGPGTLDVNTLDLAFRMDNNSYINAATGNVTFSNTIVSVNNLLRLGRIAGGPTPPSATLNISGGAVTIRSNVTIEGSAVINVTNAPLVFVRPATLTLNNLTVDGGSLSNNAGTIRVTNTLNMANNGTILGNPAFDMGNLSATWNVQGAAGGGLTVNNSFQGAGTYNGNLVQGAGGIIGPGGNGTAGTLNISGNLTLNAGTLRFDLSSSGTFGNDQISVSGALTLNATNDVNLTALGGAFDTANPYTLMSSSGLTGNQNNFRVTGPLAQSRYTFAFDTTSTANAVKLIVGGAGGANLTWVGDGTANVWDTATFNWSNGGANRFFTLDNVTFNDSGSATPAISMANTLLPGAMTVNNTTKNYSFGGSGSLAASGSLVKSGTGSLTFNNSAANSFSSLVVVSNGPVTFSNNGQNSFNSGLNIYGGSVTFAGTSSNLIANPGSGYTTIIAAGASLAVNNANANSFGGAPIALDGTLSFNQAADSALDGDISGAGTLIKDGAGKLTVTGNNLGLGGVVQINGGTVKTITTTALGSTGAIITNSATLDLVGRNLGTLSVTVSGTGVGGNGAIISTGPPLLSGTAGTGLGAITLAGNTTVGCTGPWDTDPVKNLGVWGLNTGTLSTGGTNYSLTKVGSGQFGLSGANVDPFLGHIDVQQGLLALQGGTSGLGDPASNMVIRAGGTVSFYDTGTAWDKKFVLFGNGTTPNLFNYNGANTIIGPVTLNGNCVIGAAPAARGTPISLTLAGPIGGTGSLIKAGQQDTLILSGTNTYTGTTTVNSGRLVIDGGNVGGGLVTNFAGTTLAGVGSNSGPVVVNGTLSPGNDSTVIGAFRTGPLTLNGATLRFDVDSTGDFLNVNGNLTLNGTIPVQLVPGFSLALGQIPLIHYSGSLIGNTNQLQLQSLPPGFTANLYSNANTIGLNVSYVPVNKTWRGGATAGPSLWDTATTNWDNAGNPDRYNSGDFASFDDVGTNIVSLVGTLTPATMTLNNSSSTYWFGGAGRLSGASSLTMNNGGSLIVTNAGSNDFSGAINVNAGVLQAGNGGASGNLGIGPITNLSVVVFNRSNTITANNNFFQTGVVTNMGGGVLILGGDNSLADMNLTVLTNTTLRANSATALGRNVGTTLILNGGTLDINGQNLGAKSVTVSGAGVGTNGAIINNGAAQISALQYIIMQTNVTFGGSNRWDLRAGTASTLDTGGQPFNITKTGTNQVSFVSITNIDGALADIDIQQGIFSLQNNTGQLGDPARTVTVRTNAALDLLALNLFPLNKVIVMQNLATITNESGASFIVGPVSLTGKATFGIAATSLTISNDNALIGSAVTNIVKNGTGTLILISNSLPACTLLDLAAGTLDLSQAATTSVTLGAGQTIKGNGALLGNLTATAGSTVSPGASVGVLTVKGNVTMGGTNLMEVDRTANTNDLLRATNTTASTITYGGTLRIATLAGTITAGNSFKLFSATNYNGSFTNIVPSAPGTGLGWNTNTLTTDGTLRVVATVNTTPTNITATLVANQLNLSWPADHIGWRLQGQTNAPGTGLRTNWFDVPGSTTVNSISVPIGATNGSAFFRLIYP